LRAGSFVYNFERTWVTESNKQLLDEHKNETEMSSKEQKLLPLGKETFEIEGSTMLTGWRLESDRFTDPARVKGYIGDSRACYFNISSSVLHWIYNFGLCWAFGQG